jgi:integral membrane protein
MLKELLKTRIGQLRIIAFFEGISLLMLFFITMPLKYFFDQPALTTPVGYAHGFLFILYIIYTYLVSRQYKWNHFKTTWKVVLASFIPFGTFYIDKKILSQYE